MQHSRSGIHQTSARDDELRDERLPFTGSPGDPKDNEIPSRQVMDTIPGFVWSALPGGDVEFCNQRWLDYTGMSFNEIKGWDGRPQFTPTT